ncbi:MAG: hypothetical protein PHY45_00790 [Rhodocyclaceae bacterium]|nr:hypothetical protein [Rhodocyclaceae bacterium]
MNIREYVFGALILVGVAFGGSFWGVPAMQTLKDWVKPEAKAAAAVVAAPQAGRPSALRPLAAQIALCRKQGPGFQACMYAAGYAVNAAWATAHDGDISGAAGTSRFSDAIEVVGDPYRAGASPVYGVPYWTPRP